MIDRPIVEQWMVDLRSGDFNQSRQGFYFDNGSFCALGVLIARARVEGKLGYDISTSQVLKSVVKLTDRQVDRIAEMNDGGSSFTEIADWIESNILGAQE